MGLTIHYGLSTDCTDVETVRSSVQAMRHIALQLPFQDVGEIVEFCGEECKSKDRDDVHRWLKIQAAQYLKSRVCHISLVPVHIIAFTAIPGPGSDPANIGFARYPSTIDVKFADKMHRLRTQLTGWSWSSFTKTQYASDPEYGGVPNFVRCHLCVISLLDLIRKRQLANVEVNDESDYCDHRDVRRLAEAVGEWNEMIAAIAGQFKDVLAGIQIEAPIVQFADFEHLEARGQDKLAKRFS